MGCRIKASTLDVQSSDGCCCCWSSRESMNRSSRFGCGSMMRASIFRRKVRSRGPSAKKKHHHPGAHTAGERSDDDDKKERTNERGGATENTRSFERVGERPRFSRLVPVSSSFSPSSFFASAAAAGPRIRLPGGDGTARPSLSGGGDRRRRWGVARAGRFRFHFHSFVVTLVLASSPPRPSSTVPSSSSCSTTGRRGSAEASGGAGR
mmetsp:Transcript_23355/g.55265  ORF Transcript_23355/g.55265 Transcript_23355/m.55265 type:complete len:208 (-) Transcript_23355:1199-1822(-)